MVTDKEIFRLVDASPSLSNGSKIAYKKQLQSLKKAVGYDISKIILHPLGVELLDTAFATKIAYTNAVNSLFKRDKEFSQEVGADTGLLDYVGEDARKKWADLLKQLHVQRETLVDMNVRSQREKENWVSKKEWKEMDENLSMTERGSQTQLLVAFHTQIPPPRGGDLAQVRICDDEKECPEGNIIIISGSNPRLIIRDHKTRRKYGAIVIKLPSSLEQDVYVSLEAQPREYLFVNSHNEMYPTRDAFMTWKSNTFKRLFNRDVTTNIARREYATSEDMNAPLHKLKESAKAMGHSVETHHAYRVAPQGDELSGGSLFEDMEVNMIYRVRKLPGGPDTDRYGTPIPDHFTAYLFSKHFERDLRRIPIDQAVAFSAINLDAPDLPRKFQNWQDGFHRGRNRRIDEEGGYWMDEEPLLGFHRAEWKLIEVPSRFFEFTGLSDYEIQRRKKTLEQLGRAETKEAEEKRQDWNLRRDLAANTEVELLDEVNKEVVRKALPPEIFYKIGQFVSEEAGDLMKENMLREYQNIPAYEARPTSGYVQPNMEPPAQRRREGGEMHGGAYLKVKDLKIGQKYIFKKRTGGTPNGLIIEGTVEDIVPVPGFTDLALLKYPIKLLAVADDRYSDYEIRNLEKIGPWRIHDNHWLIKDFTKDSEKHALESIGRVHTGIPANALGNVAEFLGHKGATGDYIRQEVADKDRPGDVPSILRPRVESGLASMTGKRAREDEQPSMEPPAQRTREEAAAALEGGGFFSDVKKYLGLAGTETSIQSTIEPRDLQKMCEQAYARFNGRKPVNVGKWDLIRQTDEDLLYRYGDTFVVAVRGTQGAPNGPDWTANQTIPFNGLVTTQRCATDLATVTGWKREFPMGTWYATGHSLGGAICDELLRAGLVIEAYTFNPAVQTKDFNGKLKNRRVYARGDPLYQLFGRFTLGSILQPAASLSKELLTRVSPTYFAANALDQHNLSAFDTSTLNGGVIGGATIAERGLANKVREEYELDPGLPQYDNVAYNELRAVANTVIHHRNPRPIGHGVEDLFNDVIADPNKYGLKEWNGVEWMPAKYNHLKDLGQARLDEALAPDSKLSVQRSGVVLPRPAPALSRIERYEAATRDTIAKAKVTEEQRAVMLERMQERIKQMKALEDQPQKENENSVPPLSPLKRLRVTS